MELPTSQTIISTFFLSQFVSNLSISQRIWRKRCPRCVFSEVLNVPRGGGLSGRLRTLEAALYFLGLINGISRPREKSDSLQSPDSTSPQLLAISIIQDDRGDTCKPHACDSQRETTRAEPGGCNRRILLEAGKIPLRFFCGVQRIPYLIQEAAEITLKILNSLQGAA